MLRQDINAYHKQKMIKKSIARAKIDAKATKEKGLLIVNTGIGKGKTTAAFGMVMRALSHNMRIGIVQFVKGLRPTGERVFLERFETITFYAKGDGFTWETQDREKDIFLAQQAWEVAKSMLSNPDYDFVLCDELNIVLRYGYLPLTEILQTLKTRPLHQHAIITGRHAAESLVEAADLVTKMECVKHPFRQGIKAQKGIEF